MISKVFNMVSVVLDAAGTVLLLVTMITVVIEVSLRYVFSIPNIWTDTLATQCYAWLTLIGASAAVQDDTNLSVSYFKNLIKMPWLRTGVELLSLTVVTIFGYLLTKSALLLIHVQASGQVGGINLPYGVVYSVIPVCGVLICIFSILRGVLIIARLRRVTDP